MTGARIAARSALVLLVAAGCASRRSAGTASSGNGGSDAGAARDAAGGAQDAAADAGGTADVASADVSRPPVGTGTLTGVVYFRLHDGSRLPVAEPVVYHVAEALVLAPLDRASSCDCGYPEGAYTGSFEGRFTLTDVPAGWVRLVVQKGSFRRNRRVWVEADEVTEVPAQITELPVRHDPPGGDEVPNIVIGTGRFDAIEDIFAKLRMGPITPSFTFDYEAYMEDREAWGVTLMLYQQPREMEDNGKELIAPDFGQLLSDPQTLPRWHFVFAPCAEYDTYGRLLTSAAVRGSIREFVNGGGKLYVTDYAYDVVEQVFPEYIDFAAPDGRDGNADGHVGEPDYMGTAAYGTLMYSSHNKAQDPQLAAWLRSAGGTDDGQVGTTGNWVNLNGVGAGRQCCVDGEPVEVTPDVVMDGPNGVDPMFGSFGPSHETWEEADAAGANHPHTLRFPYGCGEVMYSTYHTVDPDERQAGLAPQELVLLYLILQISECNENPIKEIR